MPLILGFAVVLIFVIVVNYAQQFLEKQRYRSSSQFAETLGLTFQRKQIPPGPGIPGDFLLFAQGTPESKLNVMTGTYGETPLTIYEYIFVIDLGRFEESFLQTVIQIRIPDASIPQFTLCPQDQIEPIIRNIANKDGKDRLLGTTGIRLPNHPEFRDRYKLMGSDIPQLQNRFDSEHVQQALTVLEGKPYKDIICVEGARESILLYPLYTRISLKHLPDFLEKSINLARNIASIIS